MGWSTLYSPHCWPWSNRHDCQTHPPQDWDSAGWSLWHHGWYLENAAYSKNVWLGQILAPSFKMPFGWVFHDEMSYVWHRNSHLSSLIGRQMGSRCSWLSDKLCTCWEECLFSIPNDYLLYWPVARISSLIFVRIIYINQPYNLPLFMYVMSIMGSFQMFCSEDMKVAQLKQTHFQVNNLKPAEQQSKTTKNSTDINLWYTLPWMELNLGDVGIGLTAAGNLRKYSHTFHVNA